MIRPILSLFLVSLIYFPSLVVAQDDEIWDPLEPVNRGVFWFNDTLDVYVAEPVAQVYDDYVPQFAQDGVHNFFLNLQYPRYAVSDILQLKFCQLFDHTARFLINTTIGIGGLIDVAEDFGLPDHKEDFGVALAGMGAPPGPYLVLPVLGPSNLRDALGKIVDGFLWPVNHISSTNWNDDTQTGVSYGLTAIDLIDTRAGLLEAIEAGKDASLDFYLFSQSSYYQYREGLLYDGEAPEKKGNTESDDDFKDDDFGDGELVPDPDFDDGVDSDSNDRITE